MMELEGEAHIDSRFDFTKEYSIRFVCKTKRAEAMAMTPNMLRL